MHLSPRDQGFPHSAILHAIVRNANNGPIFTLANLRVSAPLPRGGPHKI